VKRSRPSGRTRAALSASVQRRVNTYALAAGAAGVSLLSLAQPSGAEVVYTPANETIGRGGSYKLDLNHDGLTDYIIAEHTEHYSPYESFQVLSLRAAAANQANCPSSFCISGNTYAAALHLGSRIGYTGRRGWLGRNVRMADGILFGNGSVYYSGGWVNVSDRYLGLRFQINGETHFGWARLSVRFHGGPPAERTWQAQLTGYAYETTSGKTIQAGQTKGNEEDDRQVSAAGVGGQLGALAFGSGGIALWRREDSEPAVRPQEN
jgi:hypothetical protein